jgi:hypothetical protein
VVGIFIGLLVILSTYSIFQLALRTKPRLQNRAEIIQNMRASFDRFSRELRQANIIVTTLPANELLFEDGHGNLDDAPLQYLRYHLVGSDLYREVSYFSFPSAPVIRVHYNETDAGGGGPTQTVEEDRLIGEYVSSLSFSADGTTIAVTATLYLNPETLTLTTNVASRNLN